MPGDACRRGIVTTRVRHRQSTCEEQCRNWRETLASEATLDACEASSGARAGSTAEAAWKWEARAGGTVRGCTARATLFQKTCGQHRLEARRSLRRSECGWHRQEHPGMSADSPIVAGPSYRSCTASPQRRRGVTVSSLIETICEL